MKPSTNPSIGSMLRAGVPLFYVLLASAFLGHDACALDPVRGLLQYNCRTWSRQNGLPANGINALAQTRDNYLWLGTPVGLVRFDGNDFDLFDLHRVSKLQSSVVASVAPARPQGLWIGTRSEFAFYDGETFSAQSQDGSGGGWLNVQSILEASNGDLWVATQSGVTRRSAGKKFESVLPSASTPGVFDVDTVYEDPTGRIWFGTTQSGLYFWQDGKLTKFPDPALDSVIVRAVVQDKLGRIWVGSQLGLFCYDPSFHRLPMTLSTAEIDALFVDRQGAVWAGTMGSGLIRYWHDVGTTLRKSDGLADDFVTAIVEDHEGSMWIGTRGGLSQLSDVKLPTFGRGDGIIGEVCVSVSASPRGGWWAATNVGLMRFDGEKVVETFTADAGLGNAYTMAVLEARNGEVYAINGQKEVLVFSAGKLVARYPNKTWPTALVEDEQGVLAAADGTLFRVSPTAYTPYLLADGQPVPLGYVFRVTTGRDGSIWAAGSQDGILRIKDGRLTRWPVTINARAASVLWVFEDSDEVVWAGSSTGLARLKDQRIQTYTTSDGLFDNVISAIVPDENGFFWMDSDRGFFRASRRSLNDFADGKTKRVECTAFEGLDSVATAERNQQKPSGCKTSDGRIWFPTSRGVVMIDPTRLTSNPQRPTVRIQRVRANYQEFALNANAVVPPGAGDLEFEYAGLSYIAPQKIRYRYMLEGYDKDWVEAGDRRLAIYTNLKPGRYTLRVIAANADGVWNNDGDAATIELLPHFYQTLSFDVLCGGLALAALAGIFAWRVRHTRSKQRALLEARDRLKAEVVSRTADLATANTSLHQEVAGHKLTEAELKQRTQALEGEIEERKRMQLEIERVHRELMEASRQAGMAEVATSVLHNVGNVLNSINVSATLVAEKVSASESVHLAKVCALLRSREAELGAFFHADPKGRQVLGFLETMSGHCAEEKVTVGREIDSLRRNVDHVKEIVDMQQGYARISGIAERIGADELVEDALRMNAAALVRHGVRVVRDFQAVPALTVEKHKVLQVLVNLIRNAKYACDDSGRPDKVLTLRVTSDEETVHIAVIDNGVGIPAENLTRIFSHGFTTRKDGHGFGLHSGALAARELGGSLHAMSDGPGQGATFVLALPFQKENSGQ